jgi:hypothetical protein
MVQAVLFDKDRYTIPEALAYLRKHNMHPIKAPHVTSHYIRCRLENPALHSNFYTKDIGNGIKLVIGY